MEIIVFGGNGGIGHAIVRVLQARYPHATVHATWNRSANAPHIRQDARQPESGSPQSRPRWHQLDVTSEDAIRDYAARFEKVHLIINAVGVLHTADHQPEKSLEQLDADFFIRCMEINALPTLLIARNFKRTFKHGKRANLAVVSARVGSTEDNRLGGWYSYRCSKAALNMAVKNISIEWSRSLPNVCVTALHPGTTDTALSEPFQRNVPQGGLFTPEYSATCMIEVLEKTTTSDSGKFIAYNGEEIPW